MMARAHEIIDATIGKGPLCVLKSCPVRGEYFADAHGRLDWLMRAADGRCVLVRAAQHQVAEAIAARVLDVPLDDVRIDSSRPARVS